MKNLTKTVNSKTNLNAVNMASFRFLGKQHKAITKIKYIGENSPNSTLIDGVITDNDGYAADFRMVVDKNTDQVRAFFVNNKKIK